MFADLFLCLEARYTIKRSSREIGFVAIRLDICIVLTLLITGVSAEDRVALITAGFKAFWDIGDSFGADKREEVRAVAVSLYAGE